MKRILHITSSKKLTAGQRQQLESEYIASQKLSEIEWTIRAIHNYSPILPFEEQTPILFRPLFMRSLYAWLVVLKSYHKYDLVLFRHITFDPLSIIFSPLINNRISVHHAKEIEELKLIRKNWKGKLASKLEKFTGNVSIKNSIAVIGVTEEIAHYQNIARGLNKKVFVYPNGIDIDKVPLVEDNREGPNRINIAFVCGTFSEWHGLDLLLDAFDNQNESNVTIKVHLIGKISQEYITRIENSSIFVIHGYMQKEDYRKLLSRCDIALGSLAMFRQGLNEGSTLKVREMLASGIPVYSTHKDASLQNHSVFYKQDLEINIDEMVRYAINMKNYSRNDIRHDTVKYISKKYILEELIDKLKKAKFLA